MTCVGSPSRRLSCALLALLLALALAPRAAQAQTGPSALIEIPLGNFVLLGPAEAEADLYVLAVTHGPEINRAYAQFTAVYSQTLPTPINIRLYANAQELARLNAVVPPLGLDGFHTRIGSREIALVQPVPAGFFSAQTSANVIRHELNGLFLSQLSAGLIPAGLEAGINQYAETPGPRSQLSVDRLRALMEAGHADRLLPWTAVLEGDGVFVDGTVAYPQSLSMAAFLVDSHGYDSLIRVVAELGQGHSYRSALAAVYGRPVDQLEREWLAYLPSYLESRWTVNALHNYDLSPFEAALDAGAYGQAATGLEEVMPWLERSGQSGALAEAQLLHTTAQRGLSAAALADAEQDAIRRGDYERAIELAEEAQAVFAELGDSNHVHRLGDHLSHLRKIVELRQALADAQALAAAGDTVVAEDHLLALASEMQALGDNEGRAMALEAIDGLYEGRIRVAQQRQTASRFIQVLAAALAGLIVVRRAVVLGLRRPREPDIL